MSDDRTAVYHVAEVNKIIAERNRYKDLLKKIERDLGKPDCEHPCCCPGGCTGCRAMSVLAMIDYEIGEDV